VRILAQVFAAIGARAFVESQAPGPGKVDLGLWDPSLSASWNPVLVEVKRVRGSTRARVAQAVKQLTAYCKDTDTRLGLLVLTADSEPADIKSALIDGVVVLTFSADDLVEDLSRRRLGSIVRDRIVRLDPEHAVD
jgi:hypothetical protein